VKKLIYLDNSATTPVLPEVQAKMQPFFAERFGNPSSIHQFGSSARIPVEDARIEVAKALHVEPARIVFTSGGTESDYLAIVGAALANRDKGDEIVISTIEHPAVVNAAAFLQELGFTVKQVAVDQTGKVSVADLAALLTDRTVLVSIIYANNELGTVQDIAVIGDLLAEKGVLFHTDAVQAFPVLTLDLSSLPVDLVSVSAHKINGPKGVGALYIKKGVKVSPLFAGTQERKRRGGTENVPGIVGFGEACRLLTAGKDAKYQEFSAFRTYILEQLMTELRSEEYVVNGHKIDVVTSILNLSFPGIDSHTLITLLDLKGIAISGGSACAAGSLGTSKVMEALGLAPEIVKSSIRISFGITNTLEEVREATREMLNIVKSRR
jgi:cysteine desulfurase